MEKLQWVKNATTNTYNSTGCMHGMNSSMHVPVCVCVFLFLSFLIYSPVNFEKGQQPLAHWSLVRNFPNTSKHTHTHKEGCFFGLRSSLVVSSAVSSPYKQQNLYFIFKWPSWCQLVQLVCIGKCVCMCVCIFFLFCISLEIQQGH